MSKNNVYWTGLVHITYKDTELDVDIHALGEYYYSPGCMYRPNGDPGDPPDEEIDISSLEIDYVYLDDIDITAWLKDEVLKEIEELCQEAIEDGQLEMKYSEPEPDEPEDY